MKILRQFIWVAFLATPLILTSCEKEESLIDSSEQSRPELVYQGKAGKVTFDGKEMNFENLDILANYQNKINEDAKFRSIIYKKYSSKLAIGQLNNTSFERKFLFEKLTNDYLHVVNTEGMVVISGHLVRFDKQYQYEVPVNKRSLLSANDENDIDITAVRRDTYGITDIKTGIPNGRTTQISLPGNGSNYYQYIFNIQSPDPGANQTRRYIHELFGHRGANVGGITQHRLILRFKMDYLNGSGNWYAAGEPRTLNYSVTVTGNYDNVYGLYSETYSNSQTTTNPEERVIGLINNSSTAYGTWNVNVQGYIESKMISANGYNYAYINGTNCQICGPGAVLW